MTTTNCRSCGAPVTWATHARTGRPAPLDAHPHPDGDLAILATNPPTYRHAQPGDPQPRYRSHFATCPHGPAWRGDRTFPTAAPALGDTLTRAAATPPMTDPEATR